MTTISIRTPREEDAHDIAAINNYFVEHTTVNFEFAPIDAATMWQRIVQLQKEGPYFVAEEQMPDGSLRIVGYCYGHLWKTRAAYAQTLETTVYLHPSTNGKGVGRRLMHRLMQSAKQRGTHALIACITDENVASMRFHESLGFTRVAHFKEVGRKFGRWLGVVDYQLLLDTCAHGE